MKKMIGVFLVAMLVGCSSSPSEQESESDPTVNQTTEQEVLATNLKVPWDIVKVGEDFFISERGGDIVRVDREGEKTPMQLQLQQDVVEVGEGGLLGFIVAPDFEDSKEAYLYHTYVDGGKRLNRVIKVKLQDETWVEQQVLLDKIPGERIHNGGRLEMGPDDKLYVSTGDAAKESSSQDLNSLSGKILRMNLDGTIPSDNPFENSYVYSYGHRNPQGMTWSEDGTMYAAEHGSTAHDEINVIEPGNNYGWPVIQGDEQKEGMETPLFHSGDETWAPSALAYRDGKLYAAGLRGEQIREFNLDSKESSVFLSGVGRVRDILFANGNMYFITNNTDGRGNPQPEDDKLIKLSLEGEEGA
ncbi:PQQ-dependent sugar dehydrogenase [Pontibacillus yanchengensis]|uniref:Quinoprotein glucose dehydrogenase n=1 Tax=Pontibacillus yanchengensis Y32 TaxID=1385514 RepID=A0A0A2TJ27_9BACI|nr:PQQ-dependent sugar dehydrogenase [Pontibacillus yanchengensis]KGP74418.1 quinoprotein glucose dehydrogenase [Pontibacillus yanchengensis Y32]